MLTLVLLPIPISSNNYHATQHHCLSYPINYYTHGQYWSISQIWAIFTYTQISGSVMLLAIIIATHSLIIF